MDSNHHIVVILLSLAFKDTLNVSKVLFESKNSQTYLGRSTVYLFFKHQHIIWDITIIVFIDDWQLIIVCLMYCVRQQKI